MDRNRLSSLIVDERERFAREHPRSRELFDEAGRGLLAGVPMSWMARWPGGHPIFATEASGALLTDVDGIGYVDFCLGDTGAMFGHSPLPLARALATQAARGLTTMLPSEETGAVGAALERIFRLPFWQITQTASDANRSVIRWARGITRRPLILVFNGCYHGMVDDACVRLENGRTIAKPSLIGQVHDLASGTVALEFDDLDGVERALKTRNVACVLCEPALTNIGIVLPQPGLHNAVRTLTRKHGTLLAIDETHTISTGLGGYSRVCGLEPDFFIAGKAIAGGFPCAVYGFTAELRERMLGVLAQKAPGHSGLGTTLSANAMAIAALNATLSEVMTPSAYTHMIDHAAMLEDALEEALRVEGLPLHVTRIGARLELMFKAEPPRNALEAAAGLNEELSLALRLFLANRGVLITPFHNMMLTSPATTRAQLDTLRIGIAEWLRELLQK